MVEGRDGTSSNGNPPSPSPSTPDVQSPLSLPMSSSHGTDDGLEAQRSLVSSSLYGSQRHFRHSFFNTRQTSTSLFGMRNAYYQLDDMGVYLSTTAIIAMMSIVATIGIVLLVIVVTLILELGNSHKKSTSNSCASFSLNSEMNNLQGYQLPPECKTFVARYVDSNQYYMDFAVAVEAARHYLNTFHVHQDGRDLVILDIDETSLSNMPYYVAHNYGTAAWNERLWSKWVNSAIAPPLDPMLSLYTDLRAQNWSIAFITGRSQSMGPPTSLNLHNAGYKSWITLILRTPEEEKLTAIQYKSKYRRILASEGYRIRSSLGDQWSDLLGGNAGERTFKMPNPIYYIH